MKPVSLGSVVLTPETGSHMCTGEIRLFVAAAPRTQMLAVLLASVPSPGQKL